MRWATIVVLMIGCGGQDEVCDGQVDVGIDGDDYVCGWTANEGEVCDLETTDQPDSCDILCCRWDNEPDSVLKGD